MTETATAPTPIRREFNAKAAEPISTKPAIPWFPPRLRGRSFEIGSSMTAQKKADEYGRFWVKMARNVYGYAGQLLSVGDEVELDGSTAAMLVLDRSADFIRDANLDEEEKMIEKAELMGYKVEAPAKRKADLPEFQHIKPKQHQQRSSWMGGTIERRVARD